MRALRLAGLAVLAALLLSPSGDAPTTEGSPPEQDLELQARLRRLEQIEQALDEIEQLQEQRLFWIRFLDALYRAKPDTVWFTELLCAEGARGDNPQIVLEGYIELRADGRPLSSDTQERRIRDAIEALRQSLEQRMAFLGRVYSSGKEPLDPRVLGPGPRRFVFVADLVRPARAARMQGVDPKALAERISRLSEAIDSGPMPDDYLRNDPATDPRLFRPTQGEKQCEFCGWILPQNVRWCPQCGPPPGDDDNDGLPDEWEDKYAATDRHVADASEDPDNDGSTNLEEFLAGSDPGDPASIPCPFRLTKLYRKKVNLCFKGYIVKAGGDPAVIDPAFWIVQLNYGRGSTTELVRLGGTWHGYKVGPLEKKRVRRTDHGGIPDWLEDVYVLTIQRPGEDPIKLERGRWVVVGVGVPLADLKVTQGADAGTDLAAKTLGDTVTANGKDYTITELRDDAVTLKDDEGRQHTLR